MGEARRRQNNPFSRGENTFGLRRQIAKDRYGRELFAGDQVVMPQLRDFNPVWVIHDAAPVLDPGAPPNLIRIRLSCPFVITVPADSPIGEVLLVRTAEEAGTVDMVTPPGGEAGGDSDESKD